MEGSRSITGGTGDEEAGFSPTLRLSELVRFLPTSWFARSPVAWIRINSIIGHLKGISSNPDVGPLVKEYINANIYTLDFFTTAKDSLQKPREAELLVQDAVVLFEDGRDPWAALKKLKEFKEKGDPSLEKFQAELMIVSERQTSNLQDLLFLEQELDRMLLRFKTWRKVWNIAYSTTFAAVLICDVVLAGVAAPPAATAAAVAASAAMVPLRQLVGWIWDQFQSKYEVKKDVIKWLKEGTKSVIHELNCIKALVEELEINIKWIIEKAEFAIEKEEEAALKVAMSEIKRKAGTYAKRTVEDLVKEVDSRGAMLMEVTAAIMEKVNG